VTGPSKNRGLFPELPSLRRRRQRLPAVAGRAVVAVVVLAAPVVERPALALLLLRLHLA